MQRWRRHARWCPDGQPPGGIRVDVYAEYEAFPVWERGGMSSPQRLGLTPELAEELRRWNGWADERSPYGGRQTATSDERRAWWADGEVLAERLSQQSGAEVVFMWPHAQEGRDPDCPVCGSVSR